MRHRWTFLAALLVITAGAFAFRFPRLQQRLLHNDEAVHCDIFRVLWEDGRFIYDPSEYHGPTLHYFTLPVMWVTGTKTYADTTEATYRIVPVIFGTALVLLVGLLADGLGRIEALVAAVLTAVSSAMVFYSRYYIQEMLLVFFTLGAIAFGWRYARSGRLVWAILCGVSFGLMHATKETWVLAAAAMVAAIALTILWTRVMDGRWTSLRRLVDWRVPVAVLAGAVVASLFLSGFFRNNSDPRLGWLKGPVDSVLTYRTYVERGTQTTIHQQPWSYYLKTLLYTQYGNGPIWSEGFIVGLAFLGLAVAAVRRHRPRPEALSEAILGSGRWGEAATVNPDAAIEPARIWLIRFLAFYTIGLTFLYSVIRYKTPWCMLSFLHGMILLGGVGAGALLRALPRWGINLEGIASVLVSLLLVVGAAQLGAQAYQLSFDTRWLAHRAHPYAHSATLRQVREDLAILVEQTAMASKAGAKLRIHVIKHGCWPLPFYWRRLQQVAYFSAADETFTSGSTTINAWEAPLIVVDAEQQPRLESLNARLKREYDEYQQRQYGLRQGERLVVYIRNDLWQDYLKTRRK